MAWYVTQSLLIILATFALGLVVGWLWWGRVWRRVPFGESDALRTVSDRFRVLIAERDAEIDRLGRLADGGTPSVIDLRDHADTDAPRSADEVDSPADGSGGATRPGVAPGANRATDDMTALAAAVSDDPGLAGDLEPAVAEPDDLQRIEGVGPRIAAALHGADLNSYRAVADADTEQLSAALRAAGLSFAPSLMSWPLQARMLAAGDEHGLAAIKAEITAGRARPARAAAPAPDAEPKVDAEVKPQVEAEAGPQVDADPDTQPDPDTRPEPDTEPDPDTEPGALDPTPAQTSEAAEPPAAEQPTAEQPDAEPPAAGQASADRSDNAAADNDAENDDDEDDEDELERVEGIGPRIATALRKAGIHTYLQLAATDAPALQAALSASGLRFAPSLPTWSRQAALLADGDEAGFLALTRTLVPDRENGRRS